MKLAGSRRRSHPRARISAGWMEHRWVESVEAGSVIIWSEANLDPSSNPSRHQGNIPAHPPRQDRLSEMNRDPGVIAN
jgi:hypothetical protein